LTYFTFELSQFVRQVPDILENIRITSEKVEPVLEEVGQIRDLIPPIIDEVSATRKQIPAILAEVKAVRETIPPVLLEVDKTREQVPAILDELGAVRKQVPSILASVDSVTTEMKAYRPIASEALVQVEGVRKEVPGILNKTETLIDKARVAGREASSGAVTGIITGIFTAPFRIVGNFGSSVLGLSKDEADDYSEEDIAQVQEYGKELVTAGKLNDSRSWKNMDLDQEFTVSLIKIYSKEGQACRDLHLQSWTAKKLKLDKIIKLCLNEQGEWDYE